MSTLYEFLNAIFGIPLVSVLTGTIVTWFFSRLYYKKAGDEFKAEAALLQQTTQLTLRWLEAKGVNVSVIRRPDGMPTGLAHNVSVAESVTITDSCDAKK